MIAPVKMVVLEGIYHNRPLGPIAHRKSHERRQTLSLGIRNDK